MVSSLMDGDSISKIKLCLRLFALIRETPFAFIPKKDMESVVSRLNTEYGDMPPWVSSMDTPYKIELSLGFLRRVNRAKGQIKGESKGICDFICKT